jgi:hypothetical protein
VSIPAESPVEAENFLYAKIVCAVKILKNPRRETDPVTIGASYKKRKVALTSRILPLSGESCPKNWNALNSLIAFRYRPTRSAVGVDP